MEKVVVRFAPSPTGFMHIGSLRTALFNWLWARKNKGKFLLRIEDTDRERYVKGAEENILESLAWYGLDFDEEPVHQSERLDIYNKHVKVLLEKGNAYYCFCSAERLDEVRKIQEVNKQPTKYDGLCRSLSGLEVDEKLSKKESHVIRLKVPAEGATVFEDNIYGKISVENKNIDDQVLIKSDGFPTYHLANVADDHEQEVNYIIRAEEWLPSTPKHIILYQALGWELPTFAHLPIVLGADKSKLSKRHGAVSALEYKKLGYLPEAVLNFIVMLGWNPKTDQEIFSLKELISEFDLSKVNKSSAVFNIEKLDWLNGQYIKKMDLKKLSKLREPFLVEQGIDINDQKLYLSSVELEQERLNKLSDPSETASFLFHDEISYDPSLLIHKKDSKQDVIKSLGLSLNKIKSLDDDMFQVDKLKDIFTDLIEDNKLNNRVILWPLRIALTGLEKSPGVFEIMTILKKDKVLLRVEKALEKLQNG